MVLFFIMAIPLTMAKEPELMCFGEGCEEPIIMEDPEPIQEEPLQIISSGSKSKTCNMETKTCDLKNKGTIKVKFNGEVYNIKSYGLNLLGTTLVKIEGNDYSKFHPIALFNEGNWNEVNLNSLMEHLRG